MSRDTLPPAIEQKPELLTDYYRKGKVETKAELDDEMRRCKVAGLVDAAKIRWLEKKVAEMENKCDPRGAWQAMLETSSIFAGHIKSAVSVRMRKADGTMAVNDTENGEVFQKHFDRVFNAPATAQDGIEEVIKQCAILAELGELPSRDEVDHAIARAAWEKSPGVDEVQIDLSYRTTCT